MQDAGNATKIWVFTKSVHKRGQQSETEQNRTATDFDLRRLNANLASEHKPIEVKGKHVSQSKGGSSVVSADCSTSLVS